MFEVLDLDLGQIDIHAWAQGSGLPALKQERLNAPAILLMHKVAAYAAAKLADANVQVQPAPVYYSAAQQAEQARLACPMCSGCTRGLAWGPGCACLRRSEAAPVFAMVLRSRRLRVDVI